MKSSRRSFAAVALVRVVTLLAVGITAFASPRSARAAGEIIVGTADGGPPNALDGLCSLSEAIENANNDNSSQVNCSTGIGTDTILFADGLGAATVTLNATLPSIADADGLTINGGGDITISGDDSYQIVQIQAPATLQEITIIDADNYPNSGGVSVGATGSLTISRSTFAGNYAQNGGAVYTEGTLTVRRSTFNDNTASYGAAIHVAFGGSATITGSTFVANSAIAGEGGGVYSLGTVLIHNSTFTGNGAAAGQGAAVHIDIGTAGLYNNIMANSTSGDDCVEIGAGIFAVYSNLIEDSSPACGVANGVDDNIVGLDPDLAAPTGSPEYFPINPTSPAIDAGDNGLINGATLDQPGNPRTSDIPWIEDTGLGSAPIVDIGSHELSVACPGGVRLYVDADAAGGETGTSWTDAFTELAPALYTVAACGTPSIIWVAEGVYTPDWLYPGDPSRSFEVPPEAEVYGGFAGTETQRSQRDPALHATILSGDIDNNDLNVDANYIGESYLDIQGSNSDHVVWMDGQGVDITASTVLSGLVITAGAAPITSNTAGGGLYCAGASSGCSPALDRLVFSGNAAFANGGGLYVTASNAEASSPELTSVSFVGNHAPKGGGMMLVSTSSSSTANASLNRVTFSANSANEGGGLYNSAVGATNPVLTNVTFSGNSAVQEGGAMHNAAITASGSASPTLTNVTFSGNAADTGGALYGNDSSGGTVSPGLVNVILWDNTATTSGPQSEGGTPAISYSVVQGGCVSIAGATCAGNNKVQNPELGPLADNGGSTQTMALLAGSSAIDTGDAGNCSSPDQRWVTRPRGAECDIGAFERIPPFSDFDYDDMTDPAKFVPGTGMAWWLKSSTDLWDSAALGGDVASYVSRSDFNGDARTDPGKYVAAGQALYYLLSPSYAAWDGDYMGAGSYSLLPGSDFDGDQMTDPAKYQSDGSVWRLLSGTSTWAGTFIGTDAAPTLPGSDFDGDGMTDVAKYVAAGAIWYLGSDDSAWHGQYIGADGTPVPASDFDGDGITDTAKYLTGSNVLWWLGSNSGAWTGVYLGPGASIPVPAADFDGDGKTDPARFDTGGKALWWLRSSDGGLDGAYMGPETYEIVN